MNTLTGKIESITVSNHLSLVYILVRDIRLTAIVIDTPESVTYLKTGGSIQAIFKETEVIIGKGKNNDISLQNKLHGKILSIEKGNLLSRLTLDTAVGKITSVITTNAVKQLALTKGMEVTAMVKTNEIMLSE